MESSYSEWSRKRHGRRFDKSRRVVKLAVTDLSRGLISFMSRLYDQLIVLLRLPQHNIRMFSTSSLKFRRYSAIDNCSFLPKSTSVPTFFRFLVSLPQSGPEQRNGENYEI